MKEFSFIHCGDLHLGCYPNHLETRFLDFFKSFYDMIKYAIDNDIKLILISGDLFHLKVINSKTLLKTIEILQVAKEKQIEVIVIEGNHDKAFYVDEESWLIFLQSQKYIKLLQTQIIDGQLKLTAYNGETGSIIENDNYRVIGLGYMGGTTERYLKSLHNLISKSDKFTVLMLHAAIDRLSGQDMGDIKGEVILGIKDIVDYVALGHIHNRYEYAGFCYNPGSLENIRLKDGIRAGTKGFYHVIVNNDKKEINYIKSNPRTIRYERLDISGKNTPEEVEDYLLQYPFTIKEQDLLELTVYGQVNFNPYNINFSDIVDRITQKYNLLYMDLINYINIVKDAKTSEIVDMKNIVTNIIEKEIAFNYPNVSDPLKIAKTMVTLTDMVNEEVDNETIIKNLIELDVKL